MESRACPNQTELTRMATGVLHRRTDEIRAHLELCGKCRSLLDDIKQQNALLEVRLAQLTLEDVEVAGATIREEMDLAVANSESWLTAQSYELAQQTALFSTPCKVGQYELQGLIAPGGMGEVYKATHSRLKRDVAIKVIRRNQQDSPLLYDNFVREIETVGQLEHPNMVRAYDALEYEGYLFLVMELLAGDSLHSLVRKERRLQLRELLSVMVGVCEAISHLHENGYLHLDIKPANIMLLESGVTKLIDYGLAVPWEAASSREVRYGTVGYMPPEQRDAGVVDNRTDIYAAGKVFRLMVEKAADAESLQRHRDVERELRILADAMANDNREMRPKDANDVLNILLELQSQSPDDSGEQSSTVNVLPIDQKQERAKSSSILRRYSIVVSMLAALGFLFWWGVGLQSGRGNARAIGDLTNSIGMQLNVVPEGTLSVDTVYSFKGELLQLDDAKSISISPFYVGVYEVTQREFRQVMGENPSAFKGDDFPVESLTIEQAQEFCRRLSELPGEKQAGRVYRIPTNLEWEYACRAGTETKFNFGDEEWKIDSHAWYNGNSGSPHAVGLKRANAWGIYDIHGNVSELCKFDESLMPLLSEQAPSGLEFGTRGGSWAVTARQCGSGVCAVLGGGRLNRAHLGFRVVCDLMPKTIAGIKTGSEFETRLYSLKLDLREEPEPAPVRIVNAVLYREGEYSTHYWAPEDINKWAEIEYRLELPGQIESTVDFGSLVWVYNEHYFPVFDPKAQGKLEISRDGKNWHLLFHSESGTPLVDNRTSVLPLLKGSELVYLRAKLFCSVLGKRVRFSQFLRRSDTEEPHQLQFRLLSDGQKPK